MTTKASLRFAHECCTFHLKYNLYPSVSSGPCVYTLLRGKHNSSDEKLLQEVKTQCEYLGFRVSTVTTECGQSAIKSPINILKNAGGIELLKENALDELYELRFDA